MLAGTLAVVAGFPFGSSYVLQQRGARSVAPDQPGRVATRPLVALVRGEVHHPAWRLGWLANTVGLLFQMAALHTGSVALVQPLLVTQLIFALPMASAGHHRWPSTRDWWHVLAVSGGLTLILTVNGAVPAEGEPDHGRILLGAGCAVLMLAGLVAVANHCPRQVHSTLVGVGAGLCYALSAVFMKLTTESLTRDGVTATASSWFGYALAVSVPAGLVLGQQALASGSLAAAAAAMTVTNPTASYLLGAFAFHVQPPTGSGALTAVCASALLIYTGVVGLSRSTTLEPDARRGPFDTERGPKVPGR